MVVTIMQLGASASSQAAGSVVVFPTPGTRYDRPATQITFRGLPAGAIGPLEVIGSKTGVHKGRIAADSDGQGGSFLPFRRFAAGEKVTVGSHLNVLGGSHGVFSFTIANALPLVGTGPLPLAPAGSNGVQHFHSRPDLQPASLTVTNDSAPASQGDIFVAPQNGPAQTGPMILDPHGRLVWFAPYPVRTNTLITDFRVQMLFGAPVLTWWQGKTGNGLGRGVGVILNRSYQQIATVGAQNGLAMDLHEFLVTSQGDAYIVAAAPVRVPGIKKPTIDSVVQEIDIRTGLVLFEWHIMDHVPLRESYFAPKPSGYTYDPYHVNSIGIDRDGNLIVSARNTSTVYKVDRRTGRIIWRLGGKRSSFKMGPGTSTWGQHDALVQPDGTVTVFDDGAGPPTVHPYSRGIRESIDTRHMTTRLIREYDHSPRISANFEGGVQLLANGDVFLGWGQQPYFSEDDSSGHQIFNAQFTVPTTSYRAYRFHWSAQPLDAPALAATARRGGAVTLYVSWNGATDVAAWELLAGASPTTLKRISRAPKRGFETSLAAHGRGRYYAVQALGSNGTVLATSPARHVT